MGSGGKEDGKVSGNDDDRRLVSDAVVVEIRELLTLRASVLTSTIARVRHPPTAKEQTSVPHGKKSDAPGCLALLCCPLMSQ